jgi:hypothetical protein
MLRRITAVPKSRQLSFRSKGRQLPFNGIPQGNKAQGSVLTTTYAGQETIQDASYAANQIAKVPPEDTTRAQALATGPDMTI